MNLRDQITAAMQAQGITPAELARRADVHHTMLYRWLNGHRALSEATLDRLCAALGLRLVAA